MSGPAVSSLSTLPAGDAGDAATRLVNAAPQAITWTIRGNASNYLFDAQGWRWSEWTSRGRLQTIKHGPHRTVYRLTLPDGEFYLKHFRCPDWKAFFRNLFKGNPAEREWQAAHRLAELDLPTFEPIALGLKRRAGFVTDGFLITRAIPDALPLDHYLLTEFAALPARRRAAFRQDLARRLGEFAARLHAGGIEHIDLHAANVLISRTSAEQPALWLIDLHAVRFHRRLSTRLRDRNLAALHQFFAGKSTPADRRRAFAAYSTAIETPSGFHAPRKASPQRAAGLTPAVFARIKSLELQLCDAADYAWKRADRAWKRGNRHVRHIAMSTADARGLATLDAEWLQSLAAVPEAPFASHLVRWCKQRPNCRIAEVLLPCGDGHIHAYWKCREASRGISSLLDTFRLSPARRAWETGHALLRRGIDTPRPLAIVEHRGETGRRNYLLTEAIENSSTLDIFLHEHFAALLPHAQALGRQLRLTRLARQLRRLHVLGFDHRDLKFSNLLVSNDANDPRVWLLDLDHVRAWRRLPRPRAVQNLARLAVSSLAVPGLGAAERLRFLKIYLADRFAGEWKIWWRAITRRALEKQTQNRTRRRPLS